MKIWFLALFPCGCRAEIKEIKREILPMDFSHIEGNFFMDVNFSKCRFNVCISNKKNMNLEYILMMLRQIDNCVMLRILSRSFPLKN